MTDQPDLASGPAAVTVSTDLWMSLPPEARAEMDAELAELAGVDRTVALAAWHSTAEVYADPELLAALTRDHSDDADPLEVEVTAEQRAAYEAAAEARGLGLEAFVIAACDVAAGDSDDDRHTAVSPADYDRLVAALDESDQAHEQAMRKRKRGGGED